MARKPVVRIKNADYRYLGVEPTSIDNTTELIKAYNWYNYFYDTSTGRKWLSEYMRNNDKGSITSLKEVTMTMCSIARMINNDLDVPQSARAFLERKLKERVKKKSPLKITLKLDINEFIADFEDLVDEFIVKGKYFDPQTYKLFHEKEARPIDIKNFIAYYTPIRDDYQSNSGYTKEQKINGLKFFEAMISDANKYLENKKIAKPRKAKTISAAKLTKDVKYMKNDDSLKIVSVHPEKIVNAESVWLYNTKYKILTLITSDGGRLSVRGSTIFGFDKNKSKAKILRKPKEILPQIKSKTKSQGLKIINNLTTKACEFSGRMGEHTIILKVYQ